MVDIEIFHYIWFIDSEKSMFHSYLDRKYDKVLTVNIVHFPNFEITAFLLLGLPSNKRRS